MTFESSSPTAVARGCLARARWHLERAVPALSALSAEVAWESQAAGLYRAQVNEQQRQAQAFIEECDEASAWLLAYELRPVGGFDTEGEEG